MFVTVIYSKGQLEAAVNFIAEKCYDNLPYKGKKDYIRNSINSSINELVARFPNLTSISTMGYVVIGSVDAIEGIDNDANELMVEIMVDPDLASDWVSTEEIRYVSRKE